LCNKNEFIHPNEILFNALERDAVGASFEPYKMLLEVFFYTKNIVFVPKVSIQSSK